MIAKRCSHCTDSHHQHPRQNHLQHLQPSGGCFPAMARRSPTTTTSTMSSLAPSPKSNQPFSFLYGNVRLNWSRTTSGRRWSDTDDSDSCPQHITSSSSHAHFKSSALPILYAYTSQEHNDQCPSSVSGKCCDPIVIHSDDQMSVSPSSVTPPTMLPPNDDDLRRTSNNPLTELKRSRTRRDSVRRSSHRSVWWATGLANFLIVLCVLIIGGGRLLPIRGVEAGMEVLDRHLRDIDGKTPQNSSANEEGSEYFDMVFLD